MQGTVSSSSSRVHSEHPVMLTLRAVHVPETGWSCSCHTCRNNLSCWTPLAQQKNSRTYCKEIPTPGKCLEEQECKFFRLQRLGPGIRSAMSNHLEPNPPCRPAIPTASIAWHYRPRISTYYIVLPCTRRGLNRAPRSMALQGSCRAACCEWGRAGDMPPRIHCKCSQGSNRTRSRRLR